MTLEDVRQLDAVLRRRGMPISTNVIVAKLGGSKRDATKFLRQVRAEAPQAIQTPVPAPPPAPPLESTPAAAASLVPVPLLQQAEAALQAALTAERLARRAVEDVGLSAQEREHRRATHARCQRESRLAQDQVDRLRQALDSLRRDLPALQRTVVAAEGQLAQVEETARRQLLHARRQAAQAREAYTALVHQVAAIAGLGAVPPETGS